MLQDRGAGLTGAGLVWWSVEYPAFVTAATVPSSGQVDGTSRGDPRQT